jgi:chromosome partitioning protein
VQVIRPAIPGVDLLPGPRAVNDWNLPRPFEQPYEAQTCIRSFLGPIRDRYDLVLIDFPPNLCLCSRAALVASDHRIGTLQAEDYGAQGIMDVQDSVGLVTSGPNPGLELLGYLITMFIPRQTVHRAYEANLRNLYGSQVFATMIPHVADYPEAISFRRTVAQHKPRGAAAKAVRALADEIQARLRAGVRSAETETA